MDVNEIYKDRKSDLIIIYGFIFICNILLHIFMFYIKYKNIDHKSLYCYILLLLIGNKGYFKTDINSI